MKPMADRRGYLICHRGKGIVGVDSSSLSIPFYAQKHQNQAASSSVPHRGAGLSSAC